MDYSQFPSPDFSYPASRYESSLWRPQFHAMPSGSWTNDGTIFYQGNTVSQHGTFWEMPNITISFAVTPDMPKGLQHVPVTLTIKDLKAIVVLDVVVK